MRGPHAIASAVRDQRRDLARKVGLGVVADHPDRQEADELLAAHAATAEDSMSTRSAASVALSSLSGRFKHDVIDGEQPASRRA